MPEPDFLRIEKVGDLREFEQGTVQKLKAVHEKSLQEMTEIGVFFKSTEEYETWEGEKR